MTARAFSTSRIVREEAAAAAENVSPKIKSIVDSVEGLTLLEVSELVTALKVSDFVGEDRGEWGLLRELKRGGWSEDGVLACRCWNS